MRSYSCNSRKQMYVNCWHINPIESDAMWKLYTANDRFQEGIAIRTTLGRLRESFASAKERIFIGQVSYIDYTKANWLTSVWNPDTGKEEGLIPSYGGGFQSILHKRSSFEHERELRCVFWDPHVKNGKIDLSCVDIENGVSIPIDLNSLIESIYIAPSSGAWFKELVVNLLQKFEVSKDVIHSELAERPVF